MLVAEEGETDVRAVGVPRDEPRDDGVDEKRVAAVDEEVELVLLAFHSAPLCSRRHLAGDKPPTGLELQGPDLVAEALDVAELDALVAADQVGEVRELHRARVALGREPD